MVVKDGYFIPRFPHCFFFFFPLKTEEFPGINSVLPLHNEIAFLHFLLKICSDVIISLPSQLEVLQHQKWRYEKLEVHFNFVSCILIRNMCSCSRERR